MNLLIYSLLLTLITLPVWCQAVTHILPDGLSMSVQLTPGDVQTFEFPIAVALSPAWVIVTPCNGFVEWKLLKRVVTRADVSLNVVEHNHDFNHVPNTLAPDDSLQYSLLTMTPLQNQGQHVTTTTSTLLEQTSNRRMEYFMDSLIYGTTLVIELRSNDTQSVQLFATSDVTKMQQYAPPLPSDVNHRQIRLVAVDAHSFTVKWEHSPSVYHKGSSIEYCIVVARAQHISSPEFCALTNKRPSSDKEDAPKIRCVAHHTKVTMQGLQPATKYYVRVHVVNWHSSAASAYDGISVETSVAAPTTTQTKKFDASSSVLILHDAQVQSGNLEKTGDKKRVYQFLVEKFANEVLLIVQPCNGFVRVIIRTQDGKVLRRFESFSDFRRLTLHRVQPGSLLIDVIHDDYKHPIVYKLWMSRRPHKDPYPVLPDDTSIKSIEHDRTCKQLRLAWLPSLGRVRYCLYVRAEKSSYFKELMDEQPNLCFGPPDGAQKVVCTTAEYHTGSLLDGPLTQLVSQLHAGVTYRFDLYATYAHRPHPQTLNYRTVWAKTKAENC